MRFNKSPVFLYIFKVVVLALSAATAGAATTNLSYTIEAAVKETYDDNVYIQNTVPLPNNVNTAAAAGLSAVSAHKSSFLTTVIPRLGLNWQPGEAFNATLAYAPEIALYTSAEDEDYIAHRTTLNFGGKVGDAAWELLNSPTFVEGSTIGPTFARPGDVPAIGGIPLRDRREQFVFRNTFRVTVPFGDKWFVRPVATSYYHDFLTDQRLNVNPAYSYENYLDRQDVNGGVDVGYDVGRKTYFILGYRYGRQDQFVGPNEANTAFTQSPYKCSYQRILAGLEGSPWPWLKLAALGGPEIRDWDNGTPAGFDRNRQLYWVDATATLLPDKGDTVTLLFKRFEQPAFSSQSVYEDITYSATWKHKFTQHWATSAGFQLYIGDWQEPVNRDDWIYTPSAGVTYAYNLHLSAELAWSYDIADSKTPTTAPGATYANGRQFTRNLASLAVKYTF